MAGVPVNRIRTMPQTSLPKARKYPSAQDMLAKRRAEEDEERKRKYEQYRKTFMGSR